MREPRSRASGPLLLLVLLAGAGCAAPRGDAPPPGPSAAPPSAGDGEWDAPAPEEPRPPDRRPRWEIENRVFATWTPYAWAATPDGDQARSGARVPFDGDASLAGGLRTEAWLDRVSWGIDAFYATADGEEGGTEGSLDYLTLRFGPHMRLSGPSPLELRDGEVLSIRPSVDGFVGVRTHFADGDLEGPGFFSSGDSPWWGEPVAGVRLSAMVGRRVTLHARAEGGGIDVGAWQSWSYDLEAGATVQVTDHVALAAAWRWYGASYDGDEDDLDPYGLEVRLSGPWVGLVMEF